MHSEQLGVWHFALQLALHVLEAEMAEAKKEFEEQVQLQVVKNFEARVKSFLEDK